MSRFFMVHCVKGDINTVDKKT